MNWADHSAYIELYPKEEFNYEECLLFLGRSDLEVTHQIRDGILYKLIKGDEECLLLKITGTSQSIKAEFPLGSCSAKARQEAAKYIWEWFDLDRDLEGFYNIARKDKILQPLIQNYYGLRIMGIPNLFEAITWAIMGQQINLTFAYTLKKRFTEQFGECLIFEGEPFWLFPEAEKIAALRVEDLRMLQFTSRKAEYIIGIAKAMAAGELTKEHLLQGSFEQMHSKLTAIRGIGSWTADYVIMKCLRHPNAFPIADVGLHNALKLQLALPSKPSLEEIREMAMGWEGWQAYAVFYLWRSLYV
ncbi:DNA-3-methyladenine glycosylase family protein [Metabacillus sp. RGM 3146]|uniref:DNA-3-methyladenine glycosylase family protein n=1 Tax=Metabacillus sp. RGM 3146 TaxID=3401092 RepID=UPI003B9AFD67